MYGMNVHRAVIESKEKESGATLHYVSQEYDEGNIISQIKVPISEYDTPETLCEKVKNAEKIQLINELKKFAKIKNNNKVLKK